MLKTIAIAAMLIATPAFAGSEWTAFKFTTSGQIYTNLQKNNTSASRYYYNTKPSTSKPANQCYGCHGSGTK